MRKPAKRTYPGKLVEIIQYQAAHCASNLTHRCCPLADGGHHLLQTVVWPQQSTHGDVCPAYISYILKYYGLKCTVAFDGYGNVSSTEAAEQRRRAEKCTSSDTILTSTWQQHHPKQQRKRLIHFLRQMMLTVGIYVKQADGDADSLIVSTALFFITVRRPSSCCCCRDRQIYWTC